MGELQVVRKRTLVIAAVAALSAIAPISEALRPAPLKTRSGIVVTWRPQNGVAIVAQPSGNLLAIHALRKVAPGTRVTVSGIKWGTPTSGIKWGTRPQGIKWGIKWGRNGSYQSGLRAQKVRKAVWTPVRGPIVKRIGKKAVVVGTPGGSVVFRVSFPRVQGHVANAINTLPPVGATISVRVFFGKKGVKFGRDIKYLKPPVPGASLPFAGKIVSINTAARTMVVEDDQDPGYRIRVKVKLPPEFTLTPYTVGEEVAVKGTLTTGGTLALTTIGPNANFDQADDPIAVQILTTGQPACANAVEAACPREPAAASGGDSLLGLPPAPGAPQPSSSSPSTPPSPAGGGVTPPPGGGTPPGGENPSPPLPPVCDGPGHPDGNEAQVGRHRAPNCVRRPCVVSSPRHGDRPHPCRPRSGQQRTP